MGKTVTNLQVKLQTGTDNTLVATWNFDATIKTTQGAPGAIRVGDWVTVKDGATWYNGVGIASFVFGQEWQVVELAGDRAVLGPNRSASNNIMSPINVANLNGGSGGETVVTEDTLERYIYQWFYDTGDGIWYLGDGSDQGSATQGYQTYNVGTNVIRVHFHIIPVAKTHKVNGQDTRYWTGSLAIAEWLKSSTPPEVPPTPSVEVEDYTLTASINNVDDPRSDEIEFQIYDNTTLFNTGAATVRAAMASYRCKINAGGNYRVRARSANLVGTNARVYSDWSDFATGVFTIPSPPSSITKIRGASSTSVYLEWTTVNSADTYDIEYTTNVTHFDSSNETTTITGAEVNHYTVTGLESGDEYFFRVRAVNEQGESSWTAPKSVVIGKVPAAPTTWSSATTVITGDPLTLYWVHNAEDGSNETFAQIELTVDGHTTTHTIENPNADDEEEEQPTRSYSVDTSTYKEGTQIKWRVRTAGITKTYGDWSIMRTVDIYAPPTLQLDVVDKDDVLVSVVESFPFYLKGLSGPATQEPIGYHVSITADEEYRTLDYLGEEKIVSKGDEVYMRYFNTKDALLVELTASNIDLESTISYTVTVTVSMNSGLSATATKQFSVSWTDDTYPLDAEISVDTKGYVAYITPYSRDEETGSFNAGLSLAVYRREFDGTFTEIASGLNSTRNTVVTDPHPALDYARYRIVATENATGAISYYDPPGYPVGCVYAVLQWDEAWSSFEVSNTDERAQPSWTGSIIAIPYNIDVSDNVTPDASLVSYIGRTYPVSYYGTAIDSSSTWNMEIPRTDKDTLYALRRLAIWQGDVYVREPSGSGYWANVNVSLDQQHKEVTIPVTLDITRVSGGM